MELDAHLRAWGNSYGIAVPKGVADRLGLKPGMAVHVKLEVERPRNDASRLPKWNLGIKDVKQAIEDAVYEEYQEKERRSLRGK